MTSTGWLQLAAFTGALLALTKPMGGYLSRVLDPRGRTVLDPVLGPVERLFYKWLRVDPGGEQGWKEYAASILAFSFVATCLTFAVLRLQHVLPLNPRRLGPVPADLALNTAVSFATNTNWQNYAGERMLSFFSQMVGLTFQNFVSAAAGIAVAAALVRGVARQTTRTIGHFWVDLVRINLYLLLPLSAAFALILASQGVIQTLRPFATAERVEAAAAGGTAANAQIIALGPAASQIAIKMLGTNGGGFFNANAAHPFENPTPLSNVLQMLAIFLIPSGLTHYFGRAVRNRRHGWAVWSAMVLLFLAGALACWRAESAGNPRLRSLGVDQTLGNMEGKEVRFGAASSALFATVTTDASCGAVNSMHDSFTPLGGLVTLFNIQLGEVVFGGVGSGLYGMLVFVVLAVFLTGLMTGRTPEYLGKKIEAGDVKASALAVLVPILVILGFTAWAAAAEWGRAGPLNGGPHGLSEILYAFSSAGGNNGSAFAGLSGNTVPYNLALAAAMAMGRFLVIVPVLSLAGSLALKKRLSTTAGFPVDGATFVVILVATVVVVGALTFVPALALGPVVEHVQASATTILY